MNYPAFMKRLWCQLAISYTLLTFCAMALLIVILYGLDDYKDFRAAITPENIQEEIAGEYLTVAQAIRGTGDEQWLKKTRDNFHKELLSLERNNTGTYRVTRSSHPEIYMRITDGNGRVLLSDPATMPQPVENRFTMQEKQPASQTTVTKLERDGHIWIDMPVVNDDGSIAGRLRVLYIAEFNLPVQLNSIRDFLLYSWGHVFLLCLPIGIACALVASRYVTGQLQKMNKVTESWRQGNFEARIALPNDDVLIRHSQHLNDMAQDLKMYLGLKQNMAINDERNRVARELHDTVKQKLFALGLQLGTVKSKPAVMEAAREHILEAEAITREAQYDLMEIITQLRPAGIDASSLSDRVGMIAEDFRRRFGISIEIQMTGFPRVHSYTGHHILRIVQEGLMNAVRHGKASEITITGELKGNIATFIIADNGQGFDPRGKNGGFGLVSMRDRMNELPQGTFHIQSAIGNGTTITVSWESGHGR